MKKALAIALIAVSLVTSLELRADETVCDTIACDSVSVQNRSKTLWIRQLWDNGFHINEPGVDYPRFPKFCLNVYNWGDRVFNSYDPEYVVGTGKNWKLLAKSYNWAQTYTFLFANDKRLNLRSNVFADIGGYICFMAVSVGYMFNANELIGADHTSRSNFNLNFTCARFTIDYTRQSATGGAKITKYVTNVLDIKQNLPIDDVTNKSTYLTAYYFFNHWRYSHAAAYCYSKYQIKSAGSWIGGFQYTHQNINIDFENIKELQNVEAASIDWSKVYNFNYSDYSLIGGYGYNWVLKPRVWLVNVTPLLGLGYKHLVEARSDGKRDMLALDGMVNFSVVYNHRALFASLQGRGFGSFFFDKDYTFFNSNLSLQFTVGMRF